ncbi:MAG TPA: hypothetical protein VFS44_07635 [Gemmatimonadaceae bacterium]|nr:hypothetical protein [Gemmatimonadaceae bacterium]
MRSYRSILVLAAAAAGLAACATSPRAVTTQSASGEVAGNAEAVSLVVRNDNFADMDVYAIANGESRRVGMVTGNKTARFRLDPSLYPSGQVSLVAKPVGGRGLASTGPVNVIRGQTVQFTIAPRLEQSSVEVR